MRYLLITSFVLVHLLYGAATTERSPAFQAKSSLVLVPVSVEDRHGMLLNSLTAGQFKVQVGNVEQHIVSFTHEDVPTSVAIVLDVSGSLSASIALEREGLRLFLTGVSQPAEAALYTISSHPAIASSLTSEIDRLMNPNFSFAASGSTALVDTVFEALHGLESARHPRKVILIFSDGVDNSSRHLPSELQSAIEEADVQVFAIDFPPALPGLKVAQISEDNHGYRLLTGITSRSGGTCARVHSEEQLQPVLDGFKRRIYDIYVLGFKPQGTYLDGRWHPIKVKVSVPAVRVYARTGYRAN